MHMGAPGFFGRRRDHFSQEMDARYGQGGWAVVWEIDGSICERREALAHYEDAYVEFLRAHPDVLETLVTEARDVWDTAMSNVRSGLDYDVQETHGNHFEDIAVRRAVLRLGETFKGERLIRTRAVDEATGIHLSPGVIPFHRPELVPRRRAQGWFRQGSVEEFYQSTKLLIVEEEALQRADSPERRRGPESRAPAPEPVPSRIAPGAFVTFEGREWVNRGSPGFSGGDRDADCARYDRRLGPTEWRLLWQAAGRLISRTEALAHVENAYVAWLAGNPERLDWLVAVASDVREESDEDAERSGVIRRAVRRLGRDFGGGTVLSVRGPGDEAGFLSPWVLPFHRPQLIVPAPVQGNRR
ncbi:MAG: hypothetical protein FJ087_22115, partial [Deltaproteobacteria bacterium]|nr:hypothetical protein [Deltaproteobacteria bacterium]